ncbi:YdbT [Bacillus sp. B-jedd]|nr:YdbT [Bacillus sp. B-jedd]
MKMFEPKRLHPAAAVVNAAKQIKEMIIPLATFLFLGARDGWNIFFLLLAAGGIIYVLVIGIVSWFRFTYRIEENELRLEYGVFIKKKRYIPIERIQSVDRIEGIIHRPLGLVQIKIETAGGGGGGENSEASLAAITKDEAALLEEAIAAGKNGTDPAPETEVPIVRSETVYTLSPSTLFLMASTSGGAGVVISAVMAFIFQFEEFIPYKKVFKGLESLVSNGVVVISVLVFAAFLAAWLLAVCGMMLRYGNYSLEKTETDFIISRGLLEKRKFTIPLQRIQAVQVIENPLRQLFGYAEVSVDSAGGSVEGPESSRVLLLPMVKVGDIKSILGNHLTDYNFQPEITSVPSRALGRYLFRNLAIALPPAVTLAFIFQPRGSIALIIPVLAAVWAYSKFRAAGWALEGDQLSLRFRRIPKITVHLRKNRIQSLDMGESYFQRKKHLARIAAFAKSGAGTAGGAVRDVESTDATAIYEWFSREKKNPTPEGEQASAVSAAPESSPY